MTLERLRFLIDAGVPVDVDCPDTQSRDMARPGWLAEYAATAATDARRPPVSDALGGALSGLAPPHGYRGGAGGPMPSGRRTPMCASGTRRLPKNECARTNDTLVLFQALGKVLLDTSVDDGAVRAVSFAQVPEATLRAAVEETAGLIRPRPDAAIDFFGKRYSYFRQFVPPWLQTLTFQAQDPADPVLRAVETIRTLDAAPTPARPERDLAGDRHGPLAPLYPRSRRCD